MQYVTSAQLKKINTVISKAGIDKDTKREMILGFTNGRETSSKQLYFNEADFMIKHLESLNPQKTALEKMRGKMLYYAHEMGWITTNKYNRVVADVERVNTWCLQYGKIKRKLDEYSSTELTGILTQFEYVYKSFLNSI